MCFPPHHRQQFTESASIKHFSCATSERGRLSFVSHRPDSSQPFKKGSRFCLSLIRVVQIVHRTQVIRPIVLTTTQSHTHKEEAFLTLLPSNMMTTSFWAYSCISVSQAYEKVQQTKRRSDQFVSLKKKRRPHFSFLHFSRAPINHGDTLNLQ